MVLLKDIKEYLDKDLQIDNVQDFFQNGIQFQGSDEVAKVGLCVDLTLTTIQKALDEECNLLISHHPLISEPPKIIDGLLAEKLKLLTKGNISAYVAHHPIDIHRRYSHGRLIAEQLGLYSLSEFGKEGNVNFGFSGNLRKKMSLKDFKEIVDKKINTKCLAYPFGAEEISSISIISGGGGLAVEEAAAKKIDCYITGEMKHHQLLQAKDLKINVLLAGHYETEKLGMEKLLLSITKKFKIQSIFIEN